MNATVNEVKIVKRSTFHKMSLSAKFPSGAQLKFSICNEPFDECLELRFSNDEKVLREQMKIMKKFLEPKSNENNEQRFSRLEALIIGCRSGSEVIQKCNNI